MVFDYTDYCLLWFILFYLLLFSSQCSASTEEALLEKALAVSTTPGDVASTVATPSMDFNTMSEDEQIAYALRLSMENSGMANEGMRRPFCNIVSEDEQTAFALRLSMENSDTADEVMRQPFCNTV